VATTPTGSERSSTSAALGKHPAKAKFVAPASRKNSFPPAGLGAGILLLLLFGLSALQSCDELIDKGAIITGE
jgi:hypothetical protein